MPAFITVPNHYEILSLPFPTITANTSPTTAPTLPAIKWAYKRSLLLHHPDKSLSAANTHPSNTAKPTIDQIVQAYQTLSNPVTRAEYNRTLLLHTRTDPKFPSSLEQHRSGGLETADLDDLSFNPQTGEYHLSCRCGRESGYTVTKEQLERHADDGDICVECEGCSLWIKVEFDVAAAEEEDDDKQGDVG